MILVSEELGGLGYIFQCLLCFCGVFVCFSSFSVGLDVCSWSFGLHCVILGFLNHVTITFYHDIWCMYSNRYCMYSVFTSYDYVYNVYIYTSLNIRNLPLYEYEMCLRILSLETPDTATFIGFSESTRPCPLCPLCLCWRKRRYQKRKCRRRRCGASFDDSFSGSEKGWLSEFLCRDMEINVACQADTSSLHHHKLQC